MALTDQQERFVEEYCVDCNATQAAIRAGYSKDTAYSQGSRLLKNVEVRKAIEERLAELEKDAGLRSHQILNELSNVAMADLGGLFNEDGSPKKIEQMAPEVRRTIKSIEVEIPPLLKAVFDDGEKDVRDPPKVLKVTFHDKIRSLELLGKHRRLFADRLEVEGKVTLEDLVLGSFKKPEGSG